jgi:hypothetical protein
VNIHPEHFNFQGSGVSLRICPVIR